MPQFSRILLGIALLATQLEASQVGTNISAGGQVVWWGNDIFWNDPRLPHRDHTNGMAEEDGDFLRNVVAIAAHSDALILRGDGTVFARGLNSSEGRFEPAALSNVVSTIANETACWAIKRDGTVTGWGIDIENGNKTIGSLSNVASIVQGGPNSVFVLKNDGSTEVLYTKPSANEGEIDPLTGMPISEDESNEMAAVTNQGSSNVVAIAFDSTYGFLMLGKDGTISTKGLKFRVFDTTTGLYQPKRFPPGLLSINGQVLSNVVAIAAGNTHCIALRQNGTVIAWGSSYGSQTDVPLGLSNIIAIAAGSQHSLALRRDGTVVAWGEDYAGQTSVPPGLSNVVAIAAGGDFSLALTTGTVPASVFIQPHGRLEEMERVADLVFKGRVISTSPITNKNFADWGKAHAAKLEIISQLKGNTAEKVIEFQHNTHGPNGWSGGTPPPHYVLEPGRYYLIFAEKTETADIFRQLTPMLRSEADGATLVSDGSPLPMVSVRQAHWLELTRSLGCSNATAIYHAIQKLNSMSERCVEEWRHSKDFKRETVLTAILPLVTNKDEKVAIASIGCFQTAGVVTEWEPWMDYGSATMPRLVVASNCAAQVKPYAVTLIHVATFAPTPARRVAAIAALFGTRFLSVSNSLPVWLRDQSEDVRAEAVRLLLDFRGSFAEQALDEMAGDPSAKVRSAVADVIGDGKYVGNLLTLEKLFHDPVGKDSLIEPMTMEYLKAGQRWSNIGDVHTSAGMALVKFDPDQVADILKRNLNDPGFHINFVSKLAEKDPKPWLPELVSILTERLKYVEDAASLSPNDPQKYADPFRDIILVGTYAKCWENVREYLMQLPPEKISSRESSGYMDLLEKLLWHAVGCAGCSREEANNLYALYRMKDLEKRADEVRRRFEQSNGWWFDDFDQKHPRLNSRLNR